MINLKNVAKILLIAGCYTSLLNFASGIAANAQTAQVRTDFIEVAKKATPAVVSIKVKSSAPKRSSSFFFNGREYDEDPNDFFNDNFFQQFFGTPKRQRERFEQPQIGQASGFIVSGDGYILTNGHVVKDANEIFASLNDGREFPAQVVGIDANTDIAVIRIDAKDLPFLTLGNSDDLEVGQWVMAIGNPFGLQASVTVGVVSAKGRNNLDLARIEDFIQTDAAINRGNSGGPLLTMNGEVVGMNTAIATSIGSGGGYMGIGFTIPSNLAQHVMSELIANGSITRGFLGVTLQQITNDLASAFGLKNMEGALVSDISSDSPASKAGLKQGDVILEYNNKKVSNIASLRNAISLMKPGTKLNLKVLRNNKEMAVSLAVGSFPEEEAKSMTKATKLGFEVENLTPEMARNLGYLNSSGVVVTKIEPGSPASWAGIKKGAMILSLNNKEVKTVEQFNQILKESESNKPLLLLVKQGEYTHFVSIKIE
jgi:serine protease Do